MECHLGEKEVSFPRVALLYIRLFSFHVPSPEEILRFRHLMTQSAGAQSVQSAAAALGFPHPHHPHHHLFMRNPSAGSIVAGMGPLGDVYSCIKCEKMFSTPHGLEVHARRKFKFQLLQKPSN